MGWGAPAAGSFGEARRVSMLWIKCPRLKPAKPMGGKQDPKKETYVGKYVASCRWQPLDRTGTPWRDVWPYLFYLLRIFWSCQGRGREFESRFPLHLHGSTRTSGASAVIAPMAAACAHP